MPAHAETPTPDTPTPAGLTAARLAEISRAVLDLEGRAFDFGECPIDDAAHFDSETEEARNRVLGLVAELAAALDAATAALRGDEGIGGVAEWGESDTAECTAYPPQDRCTHTRCLLRERNRLQAALALAEKDAARWRAVRDCLTVENDPDAFDDGPGRHPTRLSYLAGASFDETEWCAIGDRTVDEIVDAVITAARPTDAEARHGE